MTLVDILKKQLRALGYEQEAARTLSIMQSKNVVIYHLVYAAKDPLGNKIWQSIAKTAASAAVETQHERALEPRGDQTVFSRRNLEKFGKVRRNRTPRMGRPGRR